MIKIWQEKTKLISLKENASEVSEKDIFCRSFRKDIFCAIFYCYDINTFSLPNI